MTCRMSTPMEIFLIASSSLYGPAGPNGPASSRPEGSVKILGIDPGSRITGYGLIQAQGGSLCYIAAGRIRPPAGAMPARLGRIYADVAELIETYRADVLAIEDVFIAHNPQSALKLGQARGVAIAAAVAANLEVFEYPARTVKKAVVGTGRATKAQVQHMVRILLNLGGLPAADAADALAIAICHVNTAVHGQAARRSAPSK